MPVLRATHERRSGKDLLGLIGWGPSRPRVVASAVVTLFATNHTFYGIMDFFTAFPKDTGGRGLLDAWARVGVDPLPIVNLAATYHLFRLATEDENGDSALGHELDFEVGWSPFKPLRVYGGGGLMFPGDALSNLKGGADDMDVWAFIQTDVRL